MINSQYLFQHYFQYSPKTVAEAHGRVNLIGEHTDYNNGFVLPTIVDLKTQVSLSLRSDYKIVGISNEFGKNTADLNSKKDGTWLDFIRGLAFYLKEEGYPISGLDVAVSSNIPVGSGLSSSAALEISLLRALCPLIGLKLEDNKMAKIGQLIEHHFVGTQCGIMDQITSSCAKFGQALYLDCENLSFEAVPIFLDHTFMIIHSGAKRKLSEGKYNERKKETELAAKYLNITSLRYGNTNMLSMIKDPIILRRARHVITENDRVKKAFQYLKNNNSKSFGELMNESHESMKKDFEISSPELNHIIKIAYSVGSLGARLTGAGFGGCTVVLAPNSKCEYILQQILNNCPNSYLVTKISRNDK